MGCVSRAGADEERAHRRADDGACPVPSVLPALRDLLLRETTTIGLRWRIENKVALEREFAEVETEWGKVRIKVARWPSGEVANASPEYEDCRKLAREHKVPLKQVMQEAMRGLRGDRSRPPRRRGADGSRAD